MNHLARRAVRNRDAYELDQLIHHKSGAAPTKVLSINKRDRVKGYKKKMAGVRNGRMRDKVMMNRFFSF